MIICRFVAMTPEEQRVAMDAMGSSSASGSSRSNNTRRHTTASTMTSSNSNNSMMIDDDRSTVISATNSTSPNNNAAAGRASSQRQSLYQSFASSVSSSVNNITEHMKFYSDRASAALKEYREQQQQEKNLKQKMSHGFEMRDLYPRMGWHDMQAGVTGRLARDIASHFIQRWNHHRLSTGSYDEPILVDITDDLYFTVCARCGKEKILETALQCPQCHYDLGPCNTFSQPMSILMQPPIPSRYSYLVYLCHYSLENQQKLPFRMEGDCPVVVTNVISSPMLSSSATYIPNGDGSGSGLENDQEGILIDLCGTEAEWLHAFGLYPAVGDVILEVNGISVIQLNSHQLKRLIRRIQRGLCAYSSNNCNNKGGNTSNTLSIMFRRHYIEALHPIDNKDKEFNNNLASGSIIPNSSTSNKSLPTAPPSSSTTTAAIAGNAGLPISQASSSSSLAAATATTTVASAPPPIAINDEEYAIRRKTEAFSPNNNNSNNINNSSNKNNYYSTSSASANAEMDDTTATTVVTAEVEAIPATPTNNTVATTASTTAKKSATDYHPICQAAAQKEIALNISRFYHEIGYRASDAMPRLFDETSPGSCKVQLLRSVGKWSVGVTKTECSIWNAYVDSIRSAKYSIYIENQFFVGNNAGDGIQNNIPSAIMEKILEKYQAKEPFRVIILIPIHPNGDFCSAMKSKIVMHYEYTTINKGMQSMTQQLLKKAPGINVSDYLSFYSLKNYGVINHKIVSEQIYIHDKLMIVDDRVLIIGSANINDRSMLGSRDSEVAMKIEDTLEIDILMNGRPVSVGYLPYSLRLKLMHQHTGGDENMGNNYDFSDILKPEVYYRWKSIAMTNSSIYDQLEDNMSLYRCNSIQDYKLAMANYVHRSAHDEQVQRNLSEIKGFLVDWPQMLFKNEDLSPSLATRALIPNELWV